MSPEESLRRTLCQFAKLLHTQGLVAGLDGNVSARLSEDRFLATPTASHLGLMQPEDLLLVDLAGTTFGPGRPTSEWAMHAACYSARPDVGAVFHAHPIHVVARSLDGLGVDAGVLPEVLVSTGPVAVIPYETTGTMALAMAVGEAIAHHDAAILVRHGAVCVGRDPLQACVRMEALEHAAHILSLTRTESVPLSADEQARLTDIRHRLGSA